MGPDQRHYTLHAVHVDTSLKVMEIIQIKRINVCCTSNLKNCYHTLYVLEKYFFLAVRITYKIRKNNKQKDVKNKSLNTNLLEIQMVERIKFFSFFIK